MKKLIILMLVMFLLVGTVTAAEWDNGKRYDEETKTITIRNGCDPFGLICLGGNIAFITLNTPHNNIVGAGYQKVAEFTIYNIDDYSNPLKEMGFYDLNINEKEIIRQFDYKYKTTELVDVNDYESSCMTCKRILTGTHQELREVWKDLDSSTLLKDQVITIGIFTDVQIGDYVEWIPTYYGVKINEWAIWEQSLNADIVGYYKLDEGSGAVVDSTGNNSGTNFGATRDVAGIINDSFNFSTDTQDWADTDANIGIVDTQARTVSAWINMLNGSSLQAAIFWGTAGGSELNILNIEGANLLQFSGFSDDLKGSTTLGTNEWIHIVMTYNGTLMKLYVNGTEETISVGDPEKTLATGNSPMQFGLYNLTVGWQFFNGQIDEVGIWNRSLTDAEISDLYNGGVGITFADVFGTIITLNTPSNDSSQSISEIQFNSTIEPDTFDLTNATTEVWFSNGTLFKTNVTTLSGSSSVFNEVNFSGFFPENYLWNVEGCQGDGAGVNCSSATNNFTFEWVPFTQDAETFTPDVFETDDTRFDLNITIDSTVSNLGVFLNYNGTNYAADHTCIGTSCNMTRTLDIPLFAGGGAFENKSFFWQITFFGNFGTFSTNTSSNEQNVSNIRFDDSASCAAGARAVNFTIRNETTRALTLSGFDATFDFWLGSGTVQDSFNFSSGGTNNYEFCINHNQSFITDSLIEIENFSLQRIYEFNKQIYTNSTTTQNLFLPDADTSNIIVDVKDQGLIPLPNIIVNISRFYPDVNIYEMVESKITDEYGQIVAKLVEDDVKYRFTFYNLNNDLLKTSERLTIACRTAFCVLPFIIESEDAIFERFENLTLFSFELSFDNTTNIFTYSWDDQTGQSATHRLSVERFTLNQSSFVCNETSTTTVSSLTCNVGGNTASYTTQSFRMVSGQNEFRTAVLNVKIGSPFSIYGVEGLMWVFILLMTAISIGAFDPKIGAILYGAGFIIMGVVGLISMPIPVFFANTLLVMIFIWAVKT